MVAVIKRLEAVCRRSFGFLILTITPHALLDGLTMACLEDAPCAHGSPLLNPFDRFAMPATEASRFGRRSHQTAAENRRGTRVATPALRNIQEVPACCVLSPWQMWKAASG